MKTYHLQGRLGNSLPRKIMGGYKYVLTLILTRISTHIHFNVRGKIIYLFPNFNGPTVEVWEWIIISSHTLLGMWLVIHAEIKVNPCQ